MSDVSDVSVRGMRAKKKKKKKSIIGKLILVTKLGVINLMSRRTGFFCLFFVYLVSV